MQCSYGLMPAIIQYLVQHFFFIDQLISVCDHDKKHFISLHFVDSCAMGGNYP